MTQILPSAVNAINAEAISKTFGVHEALRGIDLAVNSGETVVILGPNGAGKTTLLKILATIMSPTSGSLVVYGQNVKDAAESIRRRIGVVSHQSFFYSSLTIYENLEFYARMYGIENRNDRIKQVIDMVGMTDRVHDRTNTLSRGMQQRISIARALLHNPDIVLLDEPETGLDQQAMSMLWKLLRDDKDKKRTVLVSTHNLERVLEVADRVIILRRGSVVYQQVAKSLNSSSLKQAYAENTAEKI
jgi:heme exporter protein A